MNSNKSKLAAAVLMSQLLSDVGKGAPTPPILRPGRIHTAWEKIQLTKAERKGKTWKQQQELRKEKYQALIGKSAV